MRVQRSQGQRVDKTIPKNGYKCGSFIMECLGRPNQINLILSRPILGDFPNILFNSTIAMNTHLRAEYFKRWYLLCFAKELRMTVFGVIY